MEYLFNFCLGMATDHSFIVHTSLFTTSLSYNLYLFTSLYAHQALGNENVPALWVEVNELRFNVLQFPLINLRPVIKSKCPDQPDQYRGFTFFMLRLDNKYHVVSLHGIIRGAKASSRCDTMTRILSTVN